MNRIRLRSWRSRRLSRRWPRIPRGPCRYGPLQHEVERSALPWRRSNPQLPAMALDDAPADCQSSAWAATASDRCAHTPEDGFLLLGSDADAVVTNVERAQRLLGIGRHGFLIAHL